MSTDGPGLYESDDAVDIRGEYRELIGDGIAGTEATDRILAGWAEYFEEYPKSERVAWLALADTQWKLGRLEDRVRRRAVEIIDSGAAQLDWDGFPAPKRRQKVLVELRARLDEPQPSIRKVRRQFRELTPYAAGDILSYRRRSGRYAALLVLGVKQDGPGGTSPTVAVLDYDGSEPIDDSSTLPDVRRAITRPWMKSPLCLSRRSSKDVATGEVTVIGHRSIDKERTLPCVLTFWSDLDETLAEFGLP